MYIYIYIYIYSYPPCEDLLATALPAMTHIFPPKEEVQIMMVFGVLARTTFPLSPNRTFAHDLPHPSWVERKVHLSTRASSAFSLLRFHR